jgi:tetratricopeptide (TPR) repeat protein
LSLAEELLNNAQSTLGGDLSIRQAIEDLQLAKSQRRLEIARLRAAHDPHPKAQSCVGRLEAEHLRLEIDIFHVRCERFPTDVSLRLELARRLKRVGNYSGAIQRLEEATLGRTASEGSAPLMAAAFIELGECWQHLRQFPKAMGFYRRAIDAADPTTDDAKLANYRAGVLAAAMNDREQARLHLAAVVAADPAFKDARERLDKLNST